MDELELTTAEKRDFIERMTELIKSGILNRNDRRDIFCVCLVACDREMGKMSRKKEE